MCQHDGQISLADVQEHEEEEERHTGDDVRIEHRDVVQESHGLLSLASHVVDAYGGYCTEQGRYRSGYEGDHESVLDCKHERACSLHCAGEQIRIQLCGESGPVAENLAFSE